MVETFQFYSHYNRLCFFLLKGGSLPGRHQLFLRLLFKFLHLLGYKMLHLCDLLYLNRSVFLAPNRMIYSDMSWLSFRYIFWRLNLNYFGLSLKTFLFALLHHNMICQPLNDVIAFMVSLLPVKP